MPPTPRFGRYAERSFGVGATDRDVQLQVGGAMRGGVRRVDVWPGAAITDDALRHLRGVAEVRLMCCTGITDAGLVHLRGASDVDLYGCHQITDAGLAHLGRARFLDLSGCHRITDRGLLALRSAVRVTLFDCHRLTAEGIEEFLAMRSSSSSKGAGGRCRVCPDYGWPSRRRRQITPRTEILPCFPEHPERYTSVVPLFPPPTPPPCVIM